MSTPIQNYPQARPYTNIQPFTVRDGATYLIVLESLRDWIRDTLVPHVDNEVGELAESWAANQEAAQEAFEASVQAIIALLASTTTDINAKVAEVDADRIAAQLARDAAAAYASSAANIQDANIAGFVNAGASATRVALNALFASKATETTVSSGRLSTAQMALDWANKATETYVATIPTLLAGKASKATQDTVETGRLSVDTLNGRFASQSDVALAVQRSGDYPLRSYFDYLHAGIKNPTQATRVVILGDSHAVGGYPSYQESQAFMHRLAYRAGAVPNPLPLLMDFTGAIPAGMKWFKGAVGGFYSATYLQPDRLAKLNAVAPHYVLHYVGFNDWVGGGSVAAFKANLISALSAIESSNASVVNVLIHGFGRTGLEASNPGWDAFGTAMGEVQALKPANRVYLDVNDIFRLLGMERDNRAGILLPDAVHMGNVGNKLMADVLGGIMGIPSESTFAQGADIRPVVFPAANSYSASVPALADVIIERTNYPRVMRINGTYFVNTTNSQMDVNADLQRTSDGVSLDAYAYRAGFTGQGSIPISGEFFIPPTVETRLRFSLAIPGGATVASNAPGPYTKVMIDLQAA